jgi:hypothetical protein
MSNRYYAYDPVDQKAKLQSHQPPWNMMTTVLQVSPPVNTKHHPEKQAPITTRQFIFMEPETFPQSAVPKQTTPRKIDRMSINYLISWILSWPMSLCKYSTISCKLSENKLYSFNSRRHQFQLSSPALYGVMFPLVQTIIKWEVQILHNNGWVLNPKQ